MLVPKDGPFLTALVSDESAIRIASPLAAVTVVVTRPVELIVPCSCVSNDTPLPLILTVPFKLISLAVRFKYLSSNPYLPLILGAFISVDELKYWVYPSVELPIILEPTVILLLKVFIPATVSLPDNPTFPFKAVCKPVI